jgi:hypothetical protein
LRPRRRLCQRAIGIDTAVVNREDLERQLKVLNSLHENLQSKT